MTNWMVEYLMDPDNLENFESMTRRQANAVNWGNGTRSQVYKLGEEVIEAAKAAQKLASLIEGWENKAEKLAEEVALSELSEAPWVAEQALGEEFPDEDYDPPGDLKAFEKWLVTLGDDEWGVLCDREDVESSKGVTFITLSLNEKRTACGWAKIPTIDGDYSETEVVI